jgi:hypothetical protein
MKRIAIIFFVTMIVSLLQFPNNDCGEGTPISGWSDAELLEIGDGNNIDAQVAADEGGNAVAVWSHNDGTQNRIWANIYTKGIGWGIPDLLEKNFPGDARSPQVSMDNNGHAMVIWYQYDGSYNSILSNMYTFGEGWSGYELVETSNGNAYGPDIEFDPFGNAIAVWHQYQGTKYSIYSNRFIPGDGWGVPSLVENDDIGDAYAPMIGIDGSGNAVVVWSQSDGTRDNAWSNTYTRGSGWNTPVMIDSEDFGHAYFPEVAVNPSGRAIAVWRQYKAPSENIWTNMYTPGGGWGSAELMETDDTGSAHNPKVDIDSSGNAIIIWTQNNGVSNNILTRRYTELSGWSNIVQIDQVDPVSSYNPEVGMDERGNAIAVWKQNDQMESNIWYARYVSGEGWRTAKYLETHTGSVLYPKMEVLSSGDAVAVWMHYPWSAYDIMSSWFIYPDTEPPVLSISEPIDALEIDVPVISVFGMTEPGSTVDINNMLVKVHHNGSFHCNVPLNPGPNNIVVTSTDEWGNSAIIQRTVTFVDPIPGIISDIVDLIDSMVELKNGIDALETDLDDIGMEIQLTNDSLEEIRENMSLIQQEIENTTVRIDNIRDLMDSLTEGSNGSLPNLVEIQDLLDSIEEDMTEEASELETLETSLDSIGDRIGSNSDDIEDLSEEMDSNKDDIDRISSLLGILAAVMIIGFIILLILVMVLSARNSRSGRKDPMDSDFE